MNIKLKVVNILLDFCKYEKIGIDEAKEAIHLLYQKEIVKEKKEMMEEFIKFMKGKIIDMPVGSGFPLVIKEGHLRNLFAHKKLDKNI